MIFRLGLPIVLLVISLSSVAVAQSVTPTPASASDSISRATIVSGNGPTLPEISLTGMTTLGVVQTGPWSINASVSVVTPGGATNAPGALGVENLAGGFVFPGAGSSLICQNTSEVTDTCTDLNFRLNLDTIDNGSTNGSYTFTVRLSLTDGTGGAGSEVAFSNFTFTVTFSDIVAIGISSTNVTDTTIDRSNFTDSFFINSTTGFATLDVTVAAVSNYQVTGSVDFTGSTIPVPNPASTFALQLSVLSGNDDGGISNLAGSFVNLSNSILTGTSLWSGPNTEGGATHIFSGRLEVRLSLDALENTISQGNLQALITLRITET